jgi:hypothetical protein
MDLFDIPDCHLIGDHYEFRRLQSTLDQQSASAVYFMNERMPSTDASELGSSGAQLETTTTIKTRLMMKTRRILRLTSLHFNYLSLLPSPEMAWAALPTFAI